MLGIQQSHPAAPHHPTTRSAAAAAVSAGQLRPTPISKRRPLQKQQQVLDTVSTTQDNPETHAEVAGAPAEDSSAWSAPPRDEQTKSDKKGESNETGNSNQQNGTEDPSENPQYGGEEEAVEQEKRDGNGEGEREDSKPDGENDYVRHPSSPLSELSPAPDEDEGLNQGEGSGENEGGDSATGSYNTEGQPHTDVLSDPANSVPLSSGGHATSGASQGNAYPGLAGSSSHQTASAHPFGQELTAIDGLPSSSASGSSTHIPFATSTPPTSSPAKSAIDITHASQSSLVPPSPSRADSTRKFSVLLELNAELSRVCQAFVASGYPPHETPEAQPFVKKLSTNLTWMSAHVDGVKLSTGIPDLEPPVLAPSAAHIAFPGGIFDRISSLYGQLSAAFSKDIMRRNQLFAHSAGAGSTTPLRGNSATPSNVSTSSIGVKRERPDSAGFSRMESPSAPKRRDTGEGKEYSNPNTPTHSISGASIDMPPPSSTGFSTPTQSHMTRPGSSMSGVGSISGGVQPDGMFSPSSSSMNMNSNLQGLGNMGGLSPGAQARARQMQIQQAQAMMLQQQLQQQQGQQHQQMAQQQGLQQQLAAQGANMSMGSPQRPTQGTPSPTRQQQMMQAQAASARQMSPPGSAGGLGSGMGMGMNGTDGVASGQQSGMAGNMPQANMNANVNGVGTSSGTNMTLNSQVLASMGPNAMAAYQALQNPSHNMTQFLNQQMPGFSQLPMMEQMRRFQIIQQRQMAQRNQMMTNQMMGGQMRPPNMNASGSGNQQMLAQGGQIGTAPQLQSSTSEGNMQFPGTPTSANMGATGMSGIGMQQQISGMAGMPNVPNVASMNPQQRQLYLMQVQMRNAGVGGNNLSGGVGTGINPAMMNPQLLQERQRLEQQQRLALAQRHGSPLNPGPNAGREQFPQGLRSNPTPTIGIARTGRSPSVSGVGDMAGAGTPRIGGRMLPGSEDYQRQALLQQAQRHAQMQQQQQQGFMQGQGQGAWPGQQSQQLPLPAGAWPQQSQQSFGMGNSTPTGGMAGVDFMTPSRQASATPAPMGHQSPTAPSNDFGDMMNW